MTHTISSREAGTRGQIRDRLAARPDLEILPIDRRGARTPTRGRAVNAADAVVCAARRRPRDAVR